MQFIMETPDSDVITLFGCRDVYDFLSTVLDGIYDGDNRPVNVRLTVDDKSAVIMSHGSVIEPAAAEMLRRLWSRPEAEHDWSHAKRVVWRNVSRSLLVEF